jgi:hypothetical protein
MDISEAELLKMADGLTPTEVEETAIELERLASLLRKKSGNPPQSPFPWQLAPRSFRIRRRR